VKYNNHTLATLWLIQAKIPGVKSAISRASGAKADVHLDAGEKVYFGDLYLEVRLLLVSYVALLPPLLN
jgi:hypothetical protein